jgi:hypothetical protein
MTAGFACTAVILGCAGASQRYDAGCASPAVRFEGRAPSGLAQHMADWPSLWNQILASGAWDQPRGYVISHVVPDTVMKRLAGDSATGIWSLAYVVANESVAGLTVAANAAQLYAALNGPARPMLVMLHDFRPSPHRLAIGLAAIHGPRDSIDRMAIRAIRCELSLQDTLPAPGYRDWEWFPASQWAGGLNEVHTEVERLSSE